MTPPPPPPRRRSLLFVPAANPRALAKSSTLVPDALIFDLEDSVDPAGKATARARLAAHLGPRSPGGPVILIRINPLAGAWGAEDVAMARTVRPDGIVVPKVESAGDLFDVAAALGGAPSMPTLFAMIETPKGLLEAARIAEAGAKLPAPLAALVVGPNDIVASTGIRVSAGRPELVPWLAQVVLAAKANGVEAIDGVFNDIADEAGFAAEASQARALGFAGKTLIHPRQIAPANHAFAPSAAEIEAARAVVAAFARPDAEGLGVIAIDGRMVERLHLHAAMRLLAKVESDDRP